LGLLTAEDEAGLGALKSGDEGLSHEYIIPPLAPSRRSFLSASSDALRVSWNFTIGS
jgi:hypothetical protein